MKIKRIAAGVLAAFTVLSAGCGKGSGEASQAEAPLVKEGTLTVAFIDGNDGFASYVDGELAGTEIYLAKRFAEDLELAVEYKEAASKEELLTMLDSGQADLALGRFPEVFEGSDAYLLSRNYGKRGYYLVSPAGNYADTLAGLDGKTVALSDEIPAETAISIPLINQVNQISFSDLSAAAEEVKRGTIAALLCTERQAYTLLDDEGLQVKELYDSPRELYCAVFPAGAAERAARFNTVVGAYLDEVAAGTIDAEGLEAAEDGLF